MANCTGCGKYCGAKPVARCPHCPNLSPVPLAHSNTVTSTLAAEETRVGTDSVSSAYDKWSKKRIPAGLPDWAESENFQHFDVADATHWSDDFVLGKTTEEDRLAQVGSSTEDDCARDFITGVIRAEKIPFSDWQDEDNQFNSYYRLAGVPEDTDGSIAVFHYSHDERKVVQRTRLGMLSPDGTFKEKSVSHGSVCSLAITESEVSNQVGGDFDDYVFSYEHSPTGEPSGMGFRASTEWYSLDS